MTIYHSTVKTRAASLRLSESDGPGLPIVLLHGAGASRQVFGRQFASTLAANHRLMALDLPGHGESANAAYPETDYTVPALADAVAELLMKRDIEHAVLVGWALGGNIAIELMARHPGVAGLMLVGTAPVGRGPVALLMGHQTNIDLMLGAKEHFSERDIQRFNELCYHGAGDPLFLEAIRRADGRLRPVVSKSLLGGDVTDQRQTVEQAAVPLAMVNGTGEPVVRLSYLAGLRYRNLWGGVCHIIPDAGHAPFWDQPIAFNALLETFATDVASAPARARQGLARSA